MEKEKIKLTENEEFEQNFKIGKVEEEQENEIRKLIEKYKEICAISSTKLGKTNVVKQDPEQYIKNSDPNLYKPYNTFSFKCIKL